MVLVIELLQLCKKKPILLYQTNYDTLPKAAAGWVFESQLRQTLVIKTGNDSFNAKRSATGVSVTGLR